MPEGSGGEVGKANTTLDRLGELLWKAIPAIGSAIGFAGFVAIIGAALLWLRFDVAGLPATQALLAAPRQELLIEGGWALGLAVLGGLAASLLVYMFDSRGDANKQTAIGIAAVATLELSTTAFLLKLNALEAIPYLLWIALIGAVLVYLMALFALRLPRRRYLKRLRREAISARTRAAKTDAALTALEVQVQEAGDEAKTMSDPLAKARVEQALAMSEWMRAANEWITTNAELPHAPSGDEAKLTKADSEPAPACERVEQKDTLPSDFELRNLLTRVKKPQRETPAPRLLALCALIALPVLVGLLLIILNTDADLWLAVLFIVAIALALTDLFIAHGTEKFLWYGVSVFFSVVVFGAVFKVAYTVRFPSVQPVALLRKNNSLGLCGVFVAQTSERVYIGRLPDGSYRPGLIFWVPTSEVDIVSVGQLKPIDGDFPQHATAMLARLYRDRAEEAPPTVKNRVRTVIKGTTPTNTKSGRQATTVTERPVSKYSSTPQVSAPLGATCTSQPGKS